MIKMLKGLGILISLVIINGCNNSEKEIKSLYEIYFLSGADVIYMEILDIKEDKIIISKTKRLDYNNPFGFAINDIASIDDDTVYIAPYKNTRNNNPAYEIYVLQHGKQVNSFKISEMMSDHFLFDKENSLLYDRHATRLSGSHPEGTATTVINTKTNTELKKIYIKGSIYNPGHIYKNKIYYLVKSAERLGYKGFDDFRFISIDRKSQAIEELFSLEEIADFGVYKDHIYALQNLNPRNPDKSVRKIVKTGLTGNIKKETITDFKANNIVIDEQQGLAFIYLDVDSTEVLVFDLNTMSIKTKLDGFTRPRNIEIHDQYIFISDRNDHSIKVYNRFDLDQSWEIELPKKMRPYIMKILPGSKLGSGDLFFE